MSDIQEYLNEHIEECRNRIETIQGYIESHMDTDSTECRKNIEVLQAAIAAMQEKQHNDELRQRLYNIFGGDMTLDLVVDELQHQLEEPDKPYPLYAKILTYEDADKWKKWKQAEQQGRLVELPCMVGDTVYDVVQCNDNICRVSPMKVCGISVFGSLRSRPNYLGEKIWNVYLEDEYTKAYRTFRDFGITVFTTLEAAQKALKGMEVDNRE